MKTTDQVEHYNLMKESSSNHENSKTRRYHASFTVLREPLRHRDFMAKIVKARLSDGIKAQIV